MIYIKYWLFAVIPAFAVSCTGPLPLICDDWISTDFFREASLSDVERCINDGVDVNESLTADLVDTSETAEEREALGLGPPLLGEKGDTPLHVAAKSSYIAGVVEAILAAGADANARDGDGRTALHVVASRYELSGELRHIDIVRVLLQGGAEVNARDLQGLTPLHMTAQVINNSTEVAEVLLAHSADVNARDEDGHTPLHVAAKWKSTSSVAEILLASGADVNAQANLAIVSSVGWFRGGRATPMHVAAAEGKGSAVIESLLSWGADVDAQMAGRVRPIHLAALNSQSDTLKALLGAGAEAEARSVIPLSDRNDDGGIYRFTGATALHWAVTNLYTTETIKVLVSAGLDVNARAQDRVTPLHFAAAVSSHVGVVDVLLQVGADPQSTDEEGLLPVDYAEENMELKDTPAFWKLNDARFR